MGWPLSWQDWAAIAQGVGSIGSLLVLGYISVRVHQHTKRRDKTDFIFRRWQEQQNINMLYAEHPDLQEVQEKIVYGDDHVYERKRAMKYTALFLRINQAHYYYLAYKFKVISHAEFIQNALPTVKIMCRERETIKYLLEQRGYEDRFRAEMMNILDMVTPPIPQTSPAD